MAQRPFGWRLWTLFVIACLTSASAGCGEEAAEQPATTAEPESTAEGPEIEEPEAQVEPTGPEEACAQAIVVAWQGAVAASDEITRSEEEARARAEEIRTRVAGDEDFAEVARADSDASSSGPRGGMLGTYTREDFPEIHAPIRDAVFDLEVGELSEVLRAPYGYVVARRCPVEKVHTRHILIRYRGADRAPEDVTRSREQAQARARELREQLDRPDGDFAALAREHSEDGSAEQGGDIGSVGRGLLKPAYEEAAFALEPNEISEVVETDYGFHIIQRLPDES